jgi:glycosyltransferase involved in cell wall biosynthesis
LVIENFEDSGTVSKQLSHFINGDENLFYLNSVVSGKAIELLKPYEIPIITHFHELKNSVNYYAGNYLKNILALSDHFIACSEAVADYLSDLKIDREKISLIHEFIKNEDDAYLEEEAKQKLKENLGLPINKKIIVGVGLGLFWRKGADLFFDVCDAYSKLSAKDDYFFLWVGGDFANDNNEKFGKWSTHLDRISKSGLSNHIKFTGKVLNVRDYLKVSEMFLLTSREDPFPLVCLEAANYHLPIICFADAGGMPEFVKDDAGFIVPFEDTKKMAGIALYLMRDDDERIKRGNCAYQRFVENHTVDATMPKILNKIRSVGKIDPLISVIVPNFNYSRYLAERLSSIYNQTFQDFEVIILDDASTDGSMEIIEKYGSKPNTRVIINKVNSGSVFHQWRKGVEKARGKYIWIAEADDYCEPGFLQKVLQPFSDNKVVLTYCNSNVADEHGKIIKNFYLNCGYYDGLGYPASKWTNDYLNDGKDEIQKVLAIKNTIPNCSAVVFKKQEFLKINFSDYDSLTFGHDWLTYVNLLMNGTVAYIAETLNYHRRHSASVISQSRKDATSTIGEYHRIHSWILNHIIISEDVLGMIHIFMKNSLLKNWDSIDLKKIGKPTEFYNL